MATMQTATPVVAAVPAQPLQAKLDEVPASTWKEKLAKRFGRAQLEVLFSKRKLIGNELRKIPERMQKVTNQAKLVLELTDDFRSGKYRSISWLSIAVGAACLVYAVSPGDVIPDAFPGIGQLDDMVVLTLAMRFLEKDLRAYARSKGYDEKQYF